MNLGKSNESKKKHYSRQQQLSANFYRPDSNWLASFLLRVDFSPEVLFSSQESLVFVCLFSIFLLSIFKPKNEIKHDKRLLTVNFSFIILSSITLLIGYSALAYWSSAFVQALLLLQIQLKYIIDDTLLNRYPYLTFYLNCVVIYCLINYPNTHVYTLYLAFLVSRYLEITIHRKYPKFSEFFEIFTQRISYMVMFIAILLAFKEYLAR